MAEIPATLGALLGWAAAVGASLAIAGAFDRGLSRADRLGRAAPVVLAASLGVGLAVAAHPDWIAGACVGAACAGLSAAVLTDLRARVISDGSSLLIALAGLLGAARLNPDLDLAASLTAAALTGLILGLAALYVRLRRGVLGLGAGDGLLACACSVWCGPYWVGLALFVAATSTALTALATRADAQTRLPFAPGLAIGFTLATVIGAWR